MTTRDPAFGEPALIAQQVPRQPDSHALPAVAYSTPGIALAAARVPGAPTLPDLDPVALGAAISVLANELYAAPPGDPGYASPSASPAPPSHPGSIPTTTAPSPALVETAPVLTTIPLHDGAPHASAAPPFVAPDFDRVPAFGVGDAFDPKHLFAEPARPEPTSRKSTLPRKEADQAHVHRADAVPMGTRALTIDAFDLGPSEPRAESRSHDVFDAHAIKREFPILGERVNGRRLVWLDNAATTQKPRAVIDRLTWFYEHENSNVHRAAHTLAARATDAYEKARESVRRFLKAGSAKEIVFVRGATEGINLIAQSWGRRNVEAGDEIVITWLEHHANIVPWQMLCAEKGAKLRVAPVDDRGEVRLDEYEKLFTSRTKLASITHVSNALGTITPVKEMVAIAHRHGVRVLVDGAQSVSHIPIDVQSIDCDFFVLSGHKVFAPTGIGAVYGKADVLEAMPPWQGGGNMIEDVTFDRTRFQPAPMRFEAGTGNIADAVGLGAALDWLTNVGIERVERYEHELLVYATERLATVPGLHMIGTAREKASVLSFLLDGHKTESIGGLLDREGIAVRSGHHCAQPILRRFGAEATVRASLALYNTRDDVEALVEALHRLQSDRGR